MVALPEREVAVGLAANVEALGIGKLLRVAVCRADANGDRGARGKAAADEFKPTFTIEKAPAEKAKAEKPAK